ncbi:MAG: hypothetical protein U0361_03695 [Nitrospiraceae bacterium]
MPVQLQQLFKLAFHQARDGDAGPPTDDLGDVFFVHFFLQETALTLFLPEVLLFEFQFALQPG